MLTIEDKAICFMEHLNNVHGAANVLLDVFNDKLEEFSVIYRGVGFDRKIKEGEVLPYQVCFSSNKEVAENFVDVISTETDLEEVYLLEAKEVRGLSIKRLYEYLLENTSDIIKEELIGYNYIVNDEKEILPEFNQWEVVDNSDPKKILIRGVDLI